MPKAYFMVRAVVTDPSLREKFDRWYASDHLPRALADLGAEKAWRLWSEAESNVHYAIYRFADMGQLRRGLNGEGFKALVADFDRTWPRGVTRSRDILNLVEEIEAP
jgi:hypothetical protein